MCARAHTVLGALSRSLLWAEGPPQVQRHLFPAKLSNLTCSHHRQSQLSEGPERRISLETMTGLNTPGNPSTSGKNSISKRKAFITGSANIGRDLIISANLTASCPGGRSCPGGSGINKRDADCPAHCRQLQSAGLHTDTPLLVRAALC